MFLTKGFQDINFSAKEKKEKSSWGSLGGTGNKSQTGTENRGDGR